MLISRGQAISIMSKVLFALSTTTRSGLLAWILLSVLMLKSHRIFTASFSATASGWCFHHCWIVSMLYFLHRDQCTILATSLCLSLYFAFARIRHPATRCDTVSSCGPQSLHCPSLVHFRMFFAWALVLRAWSCAATSIASVDRLVLGKGSEE